MRQPQLDSGYLASFCMELHLILQAGIPLDEGVGILRDGEDASHPRHLLDRVCATLQDGLPLHMALERSQGFPRYMIDMISASEETGNLERGLKALADYYTRQEQLTRNLRRAVLYPAVLLSMLMGVMVVLVVAVLPMFSDVYAQLGGSMSSIAVAMLQGGIFLKNNWFLAIFLLICLVATSIFFSIQGQKTGVRVLLSKKLGLVTATAKLTSTLSMALRSGLDLDQSLELAQRLTQHPLLLEKLAECRQQLSQGDSFVSAISKVALLPPLHCRMLGVGIQTGTLDQVMEDIAQRSDTAAQESIDHYIGNVEPTLVVIMSLLVGTVLLSVMLPLASIMSALG